MKTKIPPPIFALILIILMWAWRAFVGWGQVSVPGYWVLGAIVIGLGLAVNISAMRAFRKAQTTVNPVDPSQASHLVTDSIFSISRNPMYLGLGLFILGIAIWTSNFVNLFVVGFYIVYITIFQIKPEEDAMHKKFGAAYEDYRSRVRRWI